MSRLRLGVFAAVALAAAPALAGVKWEKGFDRAMRKALKEHRAVMVDFWADWCGWCHRLDKTTYKDDRVGDLVSESFVAVKVNTEGSAPEEDIAARYHVTSLPTILFISPSGRVIYRVDGYQGPGQFPETLEVARGQASRVLAYEDALESDASDPEALFGLAAHMFESSYYEQSRDLFLKTVQVDRRSPLSHRKRARMMLAIIDSADQRFEDSDGRLREALSLGPSSELDPKILYVLAKNYVAWGKTSAARNALQRILSEHPASAVAGRARDALQALNR